jgi:hypothetical protein
MTLAVKVKDQDRDLVYSLPRVEGSIADYRRLQNEVEAASPGYWLSVVTARDAFHERLSSGQPTGFRPPPAFLEVDPPPPSSRSLSSAGLLTQFEPGKPDYVVSYFDPRGASTFEVIDASAAVLAAARQTASDRDPRMQGTALAFASLSARNFWGIVLGSIIAFCIMTVMLALVFRSVGMGLLSLLPNLAPLIAVFGIWGFLDGRINMAAVTVFSVAFGIIVDDTIHFVMTYQRFRQKGEAVVAAIGHAVEASGTGVLATTLVIASGFFLLGLSDFHLTAQKASMVGTAVLVAFLFDLMALPACLAVASSLRERLARRSLKPLR